MIFAKAWVHWHNIPFASIQMWKYPAHRLCLIFICWPFHLPLSPSSICHHWGSWWNSSMGEVVRLSVQLYSIGECWGWMTRDLDNTWNLNRWMSTLVTSEEKELVFEGTHGMSPPRRRCWGVWVRCDLFKSSHLFCKLIYLPCKF